MNSARPSIDVVVGRCLCIVGPNGAGKSTLLKEAAGVDVRELLTWLPGLPQLAAAGASTPGAVPRPSYVSQSARYPADLRVEEFWTWQRPISEAEDRRDESLAALEERSGVGRARAWGSLSGGEAQRVRLWRSLLAGAPLLLWDEPFDGVDVKHRREIVAALKGRSLVFSTHVAAEARGLADALLFRDEIGWLGPLSLQSPAAQDYLKGMDF